jgi:hypothetical protein
MRIEHDAAVTVPGHVVYRDFPTQTVVLNLHTGRYHGLNVTAGRMLAALEQAPSIGEAARRVAARYRAPTADVERDLRELCAALLERGLIELSRPGGP